MVRITLRITRFSLTSTGQIWHKKLYRHHSYRNPVTLMSSLIMANAVKSNSVGGSKVV
jgi:hypothetical protein